MNTWNIYYYRQCTNLSKNTNWTCDPADQIIDWTTTFSWIKNTIQVNTIYWAETIVPSKTCSLVKRCKKVLENKQLFQNCVLFPHMSHTRESSWIVKPVSYKLHYTLWNYIPFVPVISLPSRVSWHCISFHYNVSVIIPYAPMQ